MSFVLISSFIERLKKSLISSHYFTNYKGGVGKTTLAYQVSVAYVVGHLECKSSLLIP